MNVSPKPDHRLTYAEYALLPDDGNQHEIIDGVHFMNPAPSTYHQTVSRRIQFALYQQVELTGLGQVFNAPTDSEHAVEQLVLTQGIYQPRKHSNRLVLTSLPQVSVDLATVW